MVMKRNLLFDKMLTAFQSFKVVFAKIISNSYTYSTPSIALVFQEYWLKVLRASPNYAILFKQSKKKYYFQD